MKTKIALFILALCPMLLFGQRWFTIDSTSTRFSFQVIEKDGSLFINAGVMPSQNFLPITHIELIDADLVISYQTKGLKKGFDFDLRPMLLTKNGTLIKPNISSLKAQSSGPESGNKLIWMDIAENILFPNNEYTLVIEKILLGNIDCADTRPEFTIKQQWPHYLAAGAGIGLIGLGQVFRAQKEEAYNTYTSYWKDDLKGIEADVYFNRAKDKETDMRNYTIAGLAILGADALVFVLRQLNIRQKQQMFDRYCVNKSSLSFDAQPLIEFGTPGVPGVAGVPANLTLGSKFILKF